MKKEYYPLTFKSVYKQMIWGGTKLRDVYLRDTPYERTGESFDITCRPDEMGIVTNGVHAGRTFTSVIKDDPIGIMGAVYNDFPLLIKLIDASDFLSVQVHPDDSYAQRVERYPFGKNEMWYILSAESMSHLIIGLKDKVTKGDFIKALNNGAVEDCLNKLYVREGDIIDIPAGLIHAVGKGIVLAEVQQNSNITYRIYDYNRKGIDDKERELHIEKSLDVIDFDHRLNKTPIKPRPIAQSDKADIFECVSNPFFKTYLYDIKGRLTREIDNHFQILTCVAGSVSVIYEGGGLRIEKGTSVFIPAGLREYALDGKGRILESYT